MRKILLTSSLMMLLFLALPQIRIVNSSPDIDTKNPSQDYSIVSNWIDTFKAYQSNDSRAYSNTDGSRQAYHGYGFNLESESTIDKVEVILEAYGTNPPERIRVKTSSDGGTSWHTINHDKILGTSELTYYIDVTGDTSWTPAKLNNDNIHVSMEYDKGTIGCFYGENTVALWNGKREYVKNLKIGNELIGWEDGKFIKATVLNVTKHIGLYRMIYIRVEGLNPYSRDKELIEKDCVLTWNHRLYEPFLKKSVQIDSLRLNESFVCGKVEDDLGNYQLATFRVVERKPFFAHECYDIQTDVKHIFGHLGMLVDIKWTGYVDWLGVRVTYCPVVEDYDCSYIGINSTIAGEPSEFSSSWEDLYNDEGLSHYLLSHNNSGIWQNDTWKDSWISTFWAKETVILNSSVTLIIAFRYYVNDSSGEMYRSTICFFNNTLSDAYNFVIGLFIGAFIMSIILIIVILCKP